MGDRDWLLLLHLWGGSAESDRSSSSPTGHCQGQHRARPSGQSVYLFTLTMFPIFLMILHTGCKKHSKQAYSLKNSGVNMSLCCPRRSLAMERPTENPHGRSCWQLVSVRVASSLLLSMQWLPSSPCENRNKLSNLLPFSRINRGGFQTVPCYSLNDANAKFYGLRS